MSSLERIRDEYESSRDEEASVFLDITETGFPQDSSRGIRILPDFGGAGDYPLILTPDLQPQSQPSDKLELTKSAKVENQDEPPENIREDQEVQLESKSKRRVLYTLLILSVGTLHCSAGGWFILYHNVQKVMPRTFGWEQVVQILGGSYDDCIDHTKNDAPVQIMSRHECSYKMGVPWIPLIGGLFSIVGLLESAFAAMQLIHLKQPCVVWIKMLVTLCFAETLHFAISLVKVFQPSDNSRSDQMRAHMNFLMLDENHNQLDIPDVIDFRWNITQIESKCCGIDHFSEWTFSIFRNGDPRFPKSCCNTTKSQCQIFPTRRNVWDRGCLSVEMDLVKTYQIQQLCLLILTECSILLVTFTLILLCQMTTGRSCLSLLRKSPSDAQEQGDTTPPVSPSTSTSSSASVVSIQTWAKRMLSERLNLYKSAKDIYNENNSGADSVRLKRPAFKKSSLPSRRIQNPSEAEKYTRFKREAQLWDKASSTNNEDENTTTGTVTNSGKSSDCKETAEASTSVKNLITLYENIC